MKSISSAQSAIDAAKGKYRDELRPKLSANLAATLDHAFEKYKAVAFRIPSPQARTSSWNFETAKDNRLWIFGTVDSLAKRTQPVWWVVLDSGIAGGYAIFLSEENGEVLFVHSIPEG